MIKSDTLPLFPLPMLILPGECAGLHIFEPRYRDMLADCLQNPRPEGDFVIVYSTGDQIEELACAVRIERVLQQHEDGRADILIRGVQRVFIQTRVQIHTYDSARVEAVPDLQPDWDEQLATHVYALHRQMLLIATGDEPSDRIYENHTSLAFAIAALSGFPLEGKQQLLAMRDEGDRLLRVKAHLETMIPLMQRLLPAWKEMLGNYALAQIALANPDDQVD